jgi:hypothetical protein
MADRSETRGGGGRDRRSFLKYAGAGGAAAIAAGCKTRDRPGGSGFTTTPGGSGDEETSEGTPVPQPLEGNTIRIGSLAPQPDSFPIGKSIWDSMQMAV